MRQQEHSGNRKTEETERAEGRKRALKWVGDLCWSVCGSLLCGWLDGGRDACDALCSLSPTREERHTEKRTTGWSGADQQNGVGLWVCEGIVCSSLGLGDTQVEESGDFMWIYLRWLQNEGKVHSLKRRDRRRRGEGADPWAWTQTYAHRHTDTGTDAHDSQPPTKSPRRG